MYADLCCGIYRFFFSFLQVVQTAIFRDDLVYGRSLMVHLFLEVFTSWDTKDTIRSAKKWSERNCRHNSLCVLPSFFCEERENRKKTRAYLPIVSNFFLFFGVLSVWRGTQLKLGRVLCHIIIKAIC